ncbi:cysteine-rich CPCC protein [Permianibacter aggregans]|uniref:Cysteine-rich CPCC protein n=3 Tax=Permianibacter aggregans TaxID=1510150 RepID=A0A4R6UJY7_9GAMM|nr:cysteine-rich CPCC protein [Permianibacter aggregans]
MGWELDTPSGANHGLTIREGRANFLKFGACEPEMVKHVVSTEQRKLFEYRPDSNAI